MLVRALIIEKVEHSSLPFQEVTSDLSAAGLLFGTSLYDFLGRCKEMRNCATGTCSF